MATALKTRMTEEEFLRLPNDGHKYELVNGEVVEVPTTIKHDFIGVNLLALLRPHARGRGFLTMSQAGYRMKPGTVRVPDAAYTRKERFPNQEPPNTFGEFAPELAIEIISPSEEPLEMQRKVNEYFEAGAVYVWHLFPEAQTIKVFTSPIDFKIYGSDDEIDGGELLPTFRCRVSEIFTIE